MIISFFGIDGSGKTTQIQLLIGWLKSNGFESFYSKAYTDQYKTSFEPLLPGWGDWTHLFAFQALHCEQYRQAILAESNNMVVCADRWDESYLAHHSTKASPLRNSCYRDLFWELNSVAFMGRIPDINVLFDIDPTASFERTKIRGQTFFDRKPISYFEEIRQHIRFLI